MVAGWLPGVGRPGGRAVGLYHLRPWIGFAVCQGAGMQTYATHRAWPNPVFVAGTLGYLIVIVVAVSTHQWLLSALALVALSTHFWSRRHAQIVQDRLILLEQRLRYERLFPGRTDWKGLRRSMLIALRFSGDGELGSLTDRALAGEFTGPDALKRAITDWQPDTHRV